MHQSPQQTYHPHRVVGFEPEPEDNVLPRIQSPYLKAMMNYVKAINSMNYEAIMDCFDERLEHSILPTSMRRPVLNYNTYGKYIADVLPMFQSLMLTPKSPLEFGHKMVLQGKIVGAGYSGREYINEFVLIVEFTVVEPKYVSMSNFPERMLPKMTNVKQYVDSKTVMSWFMEERQWISEQKKLQSQQRGRGGSTRDRERDREHGGGQLSPVQPGQASGLGYPTSPTSRYPQQGFGSYGQGYGSYGQGSGQGSGSGQGYPSSYRSGHTHRDRNT